MKKRKFYLLAFLCMFLLNGCGISGNGALISEARDFIEKGEYSKAMGNLSKVIDEDESNSEARGMYYQAFKLQNAEYYDSRKYYEQEIKELQDLLNDKSGSSQIRDLAEEKLEKAQDAFTKQKKAVITRKENAKKSADEYKDTYRSSSIYGYNYNKNKYSNSKNNGDKTDSKNTYGSNSNVNYGNGTSTSGGNSTYQKNNSQGYTNQSTQNKYTNSGAGQSNYNQQSSGQSVGQ